MNPTTQADLGTPASLLEETVTIEIDGLPATVKTGSTIMRAARESGVDSRNVRKSRARFSKHPDRSLIV